MTARLLAYGGTKFAERARLGTWPDIAVGVLGDSYGLMPPAYSFGVGVLSQAPFLIIRARLNLESRGGYPFTLLIDPSEKAWNIYSWNAARMIQDLVSGPHIQQLLNSPEECTQPFLENLFAEVQAKTVVKSVAGNKLGLLLASSLLRDKPLLITPSQLLRSERPDPRWMASELEQLDPAFRISAGWLIGGGSAHAKALGVNLILDEQEISSTSSTTSTDPGTLFMEAIETVKSDHDAHDFLRRYMNVPAWHWQQKPAEMAESVSVLAALVKGGDIESSRYRQIRSYPEGPFTNPMKRAALRAALRPEGEMHDERALLILEAALASEIELPAQDASRLGQSFLVGELSKRGYPSHTLPQSVHLPSVILIALWKKCLSETSENRPELLMKAMEQLPRLEEADLSALVDASFVNSTQDLSPWSELAANPRFGNYVRQKLKQEVRRALKEKSPRFSPQVYLLFSEDEDMEELAQEFRVTTYAGEDRQRASTCVSAWLGMLETVHHDAAEQCLLRLASSSFRSLIQLPLKREIITATGVAGQTNAPWARLQSIERLFLGGRGGCKEPPSAQEAEFLNQELEEFFEGDNTTEVPALSEIKKCIGSFSESVLQKIRAFRPPAADRAKREKWKKELILAGLKKDGDREALELVRDFPQARASLEEISEEALREFLNDLFFAALPPGSKREMKKEISNFFSHTGNSEAIRKIAAEQLRTQKSPEVARRWLENQIIPEKLIELLPNERERVMAILAGSSDFLRIFLPELTRCVERGERVSGLQLHAAMYLVKHPERAVETRRFWGNRQKYFVEKLQDLIMRSTER